MKRGKDITAGNEKKVKMLYFDERGDERGKLVIAEAKRDIPFEIMRVFYIYGSDDLVVRGKHANRKSEFVLINVAGKSKVKVIDCNSKEKVYNLDKPHTGLYLPSMVWKEMYDFSKDSVLLVLTNTYYNDSEYIRDFDKFVEEVKKRMPGKKK